MSISTISKGHTANRPVPPDADPGGPGLEHIHYHVKEMCRTIEQLESTFDYVPANTYSLLVQYRRRNEDPEIHINS